MRGCLLCVASLCIVALGAIQVPAQAVYGWTLPSGFPAPSVPADNPISDAKAELGRHLFYDTRLSGNRTQSCGTCHEQARAFTDGRGRSLGSTGQTQGVGHDNPNKSGAIGGFMLTTEQRADLIAFLESLTDEALLRDPRFANPWTTTSQ